MFRQVLEYIKPAEEVHEIYIHRFLYTLAISSITVFIPLYIYSLSSSTLPVFLFFAFYYGAALFLTLPAALLTSKMGYKRTAFLSSPFLLVFYYLLRTMDAYSWKVYVVGALGGLGIALYWTGINAQFVGSSRKDRREQQTGFFVSIPMLASIVSPFLGGVVLSLYSFETLFTIVLLVLGLSYLPFLFSAERFEGMKPGIPVFSKKNMHDFFTFFCRGVASIGRKALWPLYLAVIVTGELNIGGAGSLMALGGVIVNIYLGKKLTPENRVKMLATGGTLFAATWIGMAFVASPLQAFIISFVNGLLIHTVNLPIYSGALGIAEREDILKYLAFRDMSLNIGRLTVLSILTVLFASLALTTAFIAAFAVIALGVIGVILFGSQVEYER